MAQPNNLLERIGRILRNASIGAAMAESPAVMTASGWRQNENGDWVQDQMNNPGVKQLQGNLAKIGAAGALGATGLAGASMTPMAISSSAGGSYSIPVLRQMQMVSPMGQTFNKLQLVYQPVSKQLVDTGIRRGLQLTTGSLGGYALPRFLADEAKPEEESQPGGTPAGSPAVSEGAAQAKPEEAAPVEESGAAAPTAPQEPKPEDNKDKDKNKDNKVRWYNKAWNYTKKHPWKVGIPTAIAVKPTRDIIGHTLNYVGPGVLDIGAGIVSGSAPFNVPFVANDSTDLLWKGSIGRVKNINQNPTSQDSTKTSNSNNQSKTQVKTPEVTKTEPDSTNTPLDMNDPAVRAHAIKMNQLIQAKKDSIIQARSNM